MLFQVSQFVVICFSSSGELIQGVLVLLLLLRAVVSDSVRSQITLYVLRLEGSQEGL